MTRMACIVASLPVLVSIVPACGDLPAEPRPQWTITVATDAPVPQFADRLLIEIYDEAGEIACTGCRRQLGVGQRSAWPVSFGVVAPEDGSIPRIRARLYRTARTEFDGLPAGDLLIDAFVRLPPTETDAHVALELRMDCFGVPADVGGGLSCDAATGALAPAPVLSTEGGGGLSVGSWPVAEERPCAWDVPADMACIPGGVFLLGNPKDVFPALDALAAKDERLVLLSPYAIDVDEMTVGRVRALVNGGQISDEPTVRGNDSRADDFMCTYLGADEGANDAMPANCLDWDLAAQACASLGKRLPTEAEWEYAAGNTTFESRYPWGDEADDLCAMAILERGRSALDADTAGPSWCRTSGSSGTLPVGPVAGGSVLDVTLNGVRNMAGNVSEWVLDRSDPYTGPCWSRGNPLLVDPSCPTESALDGMSLRGSSWNSPRFNASVFSRQKIARRARAIDVGFRCAKSP